MELLRRGRSRADFERFAAAQADDLLRTAYLMTGDRSEAEDLLQECLLRLARRWPRVRSMDHPGAYARKVLVNLALDGRRARSRRHVELGAPEPLSSNGGKSASAQADARTDLLRALGELSARQRAVVVLRYFADLPEAEVAEIVGCSLGTVKSSTSRALLRLRDVLGEPEGAERAAAKEDETRRTIP